MFLIRTQPDYAYMKHAFLFGNPLEIIWWFFFSSRKINIFHGRVCTRVGVYEQTCMYKLILYICVYNLRRKCLRKHVFGAMGVAH